MKVTEVKTFLVHAVRQNWLFVKVTTDTGLTGWGEASVEAQENAVAACIDTLAKRSVIGQDPLNISKIWRQMYHQGFWRGGFIHMSAISGIDQALWDIAGKHYNVPVYMLLGGNVRDKLKCYTHAQTGKEAYHLCHELGFSGVKCCYRYGRLEAALKEIREAIGFDKELYVDQHGQLPAAKSADQMKAAAKYGVAFFEEPVGPENFEEYRLIRQNSSGLRIAAGERMYSRFDMRPLIENQLVDYIQPDVCHCGGISEIMRIASHAETYHIMFAPHNPNGPIATAASMQVSAAAHNFALLEFWSGVLNRTDNFDLDLEITDGCFKVPTKPGLGIEIHEELLAQYPFQDTQYICDFDEDGTVLDT